MTDDAPTDELAADLYRLHEAGVTVFPTVALTYAATATSLHRRRDDLEVVAALLQHDAPRAVGELLGLVQDGMGATAEACDAAGRALVQVARRYAASDDRTEAHFDALLRTGGLPEPVGPLRPPPRSGDPAFPDGPLRGPKDAA